MRRLRSSMTAVMSTSLKVVSIAAVCWDSTSRWAMVWRRRETRTRSSRSARPFWAAGCEAPLARCPSGSGSACSGAEADRGRPAPGSSAPRRRALCARPTLSPRPRPAEPRTPRPACAPKARPATAVLVLPVAVRLLGRRSLRPRIPPLGLLLGRLFPCFCFRLRLGLILLGLRAG